MDKFPHKEKDKQFVDGSTPLSHLGNLEGEKFLQATNLVNIVPKIELLGLIMIDYDLIYFFYIQLFA